MSRLRPHRDINVCADSRLDRLHNAAFVAEIQRRRTQSRARDRDCSWRARHRDRGTHKARRREQTIEMAEIFPVAIVALDRAAPFSQIPPKASLRPLALTQQFTFEAMLVGGRARSAHSRRNGIISKSYTVTATQRACTLEPNFPDGQLLLALALAAHREGEAAMRNMETAMLVQPGGKRRPLSRPTGPTSPRISFCPSGWRRY